MAEVGQRLGSGVYRLSAVSTGQSRTVCTGESPGFLLTNCAFVSGGVKEESVQERRAVQSASGSRATRRWSEKVSSVRESGSDEENGALIPAPSGFTRLLENMESLQAHKTGFHLYLWKKLLLLPPYRMTPWTAGAASIHLDTFRSPLQRRALCTFVFSSAEQGSARLGCGHGLRCLNLHPDTVKPNFITTRSYSWSSEDAPLLHRSRTAYYEILKVSHSATQSQIKTAYYKQSFMYHPDKNPGSKEAIQQFSNVSEAYTVLGNIGLRRKYDRGILSHADIQNAGRPSTKETSSRPTGSPQKHQQRPRQFSQAGGKPIFDFDAFYHAHYGEQLQRERDLRARQHMQEEMKAYRRRLRHKRMLEVTVIMLLAMSGLIIASVSGA